MDGLLQVPSAYDLSKDGIKVVIRIVQILIISNLPVTPTAERIRSLLEETVDQIKQQLESIQEAKFKGAVYAFRDGCLALQEALDIGNQPQNQLTDQSNSVSATGISNKKAEVVQKILEALQEVLEIENQPTNQLTDQSNSASATGISNKTAEVVQKILEQVMKDFRTAKDKTADLVNDSKNLTDEHRLIAWKIHLKCIAITSATPEVAARLWRHRLEDLAESSKTDTLAQYMLGQAKKSLLGQAKKSWYRKDKDLRRACEEWRREVAATALLYFKTAGEPESALRKIVDEKVQESCKASDNLITDWLGIIRSTLLGEEAKCTMLKHGLWIRARPLAITVDRRDPDSSEITEVKKMTNDGRRCKRLTVNRITDKLFEVIVSTYDRPAYDATLVRVRVEQNKDGEITVAEAGSRNSAESQVVCGVYLPSGRILVEIRDEDLNVIGHWIYDDWDAIPDPIVRSKIKVNTILGSCCGAIWSNSMLYFLGKKSGSNSLWLVPETETDRHSEFEIPGSEDCWDLRNYYQPSEQLVTIQYQSYHCKLVMVVLDMPSRTVICHT